MPDLEDRDAHQDTSDPESPIYGQRPSGDHEAHGEPTERGDGNTPENGENRENGEHHEEHDYEGEALVLTEEHEISVEVVLRGYFEPIDGRFHWYGRLRPNNEITELTASRKATVVLRTPDGDAVGTLSEPDPWNRVRILGVGRPPFPVDADSDGMGPISTQ